MYRLTIALIFAAVAFAQQDTSELFNKPPADVDRTLRARITEFFQYHVNGETRKAEPLVAEDTKEYFYEHGKPRYLSFEITRIDYSDNFTRAKAVVTAKMAIMQPGFNGMVLPIPTPSIWILENGKWCWWVDPKVRNLTPAGSMTAGPFIDGSPQAPGAIPTTTEELFSMIKADKSEVSLTGRNSEQVLIANGMPGPVTVMVYSKPPGIEAAFDNKLVQSKGKASLTLKAQDGAKAGTLVVRIQETGQTIPIQITLK